MNTRLKYLDKNKLRKILKIKYKFIITKTCLGVSFTTDVILTATFKLIYFIFQINYNKTFYYKYKDIYCRKFFLKSYCLFPFFLYV